MSGFEEFVAARGQRLLRVAWLLTGDAHLAEDLLQTALAKVWPKWPRIAEENPEAYVRQALVHTHASWWRRRWRGEVPHGEVPDRATGQDAYAEVDLEQALAAAVRALPVRQRAVVVLRYFEDLSVTETAEALGCSEGTVKSQAAKRCVRCGACCRRRSRRTAVSPVDEEQALRALLERAVPSPPPPAQRLEAVRARIRRRRRRRAAVAAGAAVLALAAGLAALPGLVRPQGAAPAAGHPARSAPAGGGAAPTPPPATPTTTPAAGYRPTGMGGLAVRPPQEWHVLPDPATASVFLSTPAQPLALPAGGCAHALDGFCTPLVRALGKGGALVMFKRQPGKAALDGKLDGYAMAVTVEEPYTSCRAVGGTYQLSRTVVGPDGSALLVWATACLAHPSKAQVAEVRELLATAAFG